MSAAVALVGCCDWLDAFRSVQFHDIGDEERNARVLLEVDHLDADSVPPAAPDVVNGEARALAAEALIDLDLRWRQEPESAALGALPERLRR